MIKGVLSFYVAKSHDDYSVARNQSNEARRLYNTLNKLKEEKSKLFKDANSQTPVANSLKVDLKSSYSESWRKIVEANQAISLPQKVAQHVGKQCDQAWKSVISKRSKKLISSNPKYKKQYCEVRFTKQAFSYGKKAVITNTVVPTGWRTGFRLPASVPLFLVESLLLLPRPDGFELKVLYIKSEEEPSSVDRGYFAGGDLGLNNLIAIVTTDGSRPKTVDGLGLKSINRYFNKEIGRLKSCRDKINNNGKGGEREKLDREIQRLWFKRDKQVNHFLNSASNEIIKYLSGIGVQEFVIGWSDGFKDKINIGKRNNQNFVTVPHARFRDLLIRKCSEFGIKVTIQEESYTSKASFVDGDVIPVFDDAVKAKYRFSGRRVSRGVYRSKSGVCLHADVNGAWNILRKCKPSIGWSSRVVAYPENLDVKI